MERAPVSLSDLPRGVTPITLHRVAALSTLGFLPQLPMEVRNLNLHGRERDPSRHELLPLEWIAAGNPYQPSAIMAIMQRFDYAYGTDVVEVVHVAGKRSGVLRLIKYAVTLGRILDRPVTGEIDRDNVAIKAALAKFGGKLERERWTLHSQ